jgi:mono/diheme cytochrome c family protein
MNRFFVPAVFAALVSGLALGLIGGVVARSPETHANVRPQGYDRTAVGYVGEVRPYEGIGLADAQVGEASDPLARGRTLFLAYGCAACHGVAAQGGIVGPKLDLEELWKEDFMPLVRTGPGGMPAFAETILSGGDLELIYGYLKTTGGGGPLPSDGAANP